MQRDSDKPLCLRNRCKQQQVWLRVFSYTHNRGANAYAHGSGLVRDNGGVSSAHQRAFRRSPCCEALPSASASTQHLPRCARPCRDLRVARSITIMHPNHHHACNSTKHHSRPPETHHSTSTISTLAQRNQTPLATTTSVRRGLSVMGTTYTHDTQILCSSLCGPTKRPSGKHTSTYAFTTTEHALRLLYNIHRIIPSRVTALTFIDDVCQCCALVLVLRRAPLDLRVCPLTSLSVLTHKTRQTTQQRVYSLSLHHLSSHA